MLRLTTDSGEIFTETAQRLVRYGCTESQAYTLARVIRLSHVTLDRETPDTAVEAAVINALIEAKTAVDGVTEVE